MEGPFSYVRTCRYFVHSIEEVAKYDKSEQSVCCLFAHVVMKSCSPESTPVAQLVDHS